jgi:hypothetical protein
MKTSTILLLSGAALVAFLLFKKLVPAKATAANANTSTAGTIAQLFGGLLGKSNQQGQSQTGGDLISYLLGSKGSSSSSGGGASGQATATFDLNKLVDSVSSWFKPSSQASGGRSPVTGKADSPVLNSGYTPAEAMYNDWQTDTMSDSPDLGTSSGNDGTWYDYTPGADSQDWSSAPDYSAAYA